MKNYINKANSIGIKIYTFNEYIEKYTINKDNKYVQVKYMDGITQTLPLTEATIAELDATQEQNLREITTRISEKTREKIRWKSGLIALWGLGSIFQFCSTNIFAGVSYALATTFYALDLAMPLKLQKSVQLAKWISDNQDEVDAVIREEVRESIKNQNIDYENMPYPKEIIDNGLSLNNIDLLKDKELRKIKRKVIAKRKNR